MENGKKGWVREVEFGFVIRWKRVIQTWQAFCQNMGDKVLMWDEENAGVCYCMITISMFVYFRSRTVQKRS